MTSIEKITGGKIIVMAVLIALVAPPVFALTLNDPAPGFSLKDSKGNIFFLADVAGARKEATIHGVMLSFFASWCVPCRKELPSSIRSLMN